VGRKTGLALVGIGVFFLVAALLSKFYAYDKLATVPFDQKTVTHSVGNNATIFDIATRSEVTTDLVSTQNVVGDPNASQTATDKEGKRVAVWETLVYTNKAGAKTNDKNPPLSATHDRIAFDATSAEAIDCCGHYTSNSASTDTGAEVRDTTTPVTGLYYKFPFDAQKHTYKFWDGDLVRSTDAVYKGTDTIEGLTVYRYEQVIPPTKVKTINAPASLFGINKSSNVNIDQMYANTRTLWVEPVTGVIIRGQEDQHVVGDYQGKQVVTFTDVVIGYDDATVTDNVDTYKPKAMQLTIVKTWLPLVGSILGVLLLVIGLALLGRRRSAEGRRAEEVEAPRAGAVA